MKKLVSFLLAITFVLAIAGCAKTDSDGPVDVQNGGSTAAPDVTDNSSNRTDDSDNSTTSKDVQIPASDVVISIEDAVGKTVENQQLVVKVIDTAAFDGLKASSIYYVWTYDKDGVISSKTTFYFYSTVEDLQADITTIGTSNIAEKNEVSLYLKVTSVIDSSSSTVRLSTWSSDSSSMRAATDKYEIVE